MLIIPSEMSYGALAALVFGESVGIPLPGGTALVAAGILASGGRLEVLTICLIGLLMTVSGANVSYLFGRRFGVNLLTIRGPFIDNRVHLVRVAEKVVVRYGWFAVLIGRSLPLLRECTSLIVGSLGMPWRRFLLWNTSGGVIWVLTQILLGYFVGRVAGIERGLAIILAVKTLVAVAFGSAIAFRRHRRIAGEKAAAD